MPPQPGETLLSTLFCDAHYYLNAPGSRPQHDRFDRGSYLYLYHNSIQRRSRIEIANNAGTPEQDAFFGYLDTVSLKYSHKQPNLCTIMVDALPSKPASPQAGDQSLWRLPAYDLRNEQRYMYKIHSLDVYFWTSQDADIFVGIMKSLLSSSQLQLEVAIAPPQAPAATLATQSEVSSYEHHDMISPVVQHLEQAAITDHYRPSTTSTSHSQLGANTPLSSRDSSTPNSQPTLAVPAPYNPAAPTAPEPIAHREKTPPPLDPAGGTGLAAAAVMEHPSQAQYAYTQQLPQQASYQTTPQQAYFAGPPQSAALASLPPPPPTLGTPRTFAGPQVSQSAGLPSPHQAMSPPPGQQHFQQSFMPQQTQYASMPQQQHASYMQSPGLPQHTPLQSPGIPITPGMPMTPGFPQHFNQATPLQSPGLPPPPPGGPPLGGYSNYTYSAQPVAFNADAYAMHSQLYRPTEGEATKHNTSAAQSAKPNRMDERIGKVEKGVSKWLKKLDQKI